MKINEITNREKATQVISLPPSAINIDEFLQEKCPIAYNSPLKIYRGFKRNESLMYIDSSKYERKSANTNNIYTLLLSEILPNWSMYPKRNKSFICSTDKGYAGSYGAQHDEAANYKVYPLGDPTIGICSDYDIWDCFRRNFNLLNMNNEVLPYIFKSAGSIKPIPKTKYELMNNIDLVSKQWLKDSKLPWKQYELSKSESQKSYLDMDISKKETSLLNVLIEMYDPERNGFQCKKLSKISSNIIGKEVWFSGPTYFVRDTDGD